MAELSGDIWASLGNALGTGVSQGVNRLTQQKLADMGAHKKQAGIEALLGKSLPQGAGYAPDDVLREYTKQNLLEPSRRSFAKAYSGEGGLPGGNEQFTERQLQLLQDKRKYEEDKAQNIKEFEATEKNRAENLALKKKAQGHEEFKTSNPLLKENLEEIDLSNKVIPLIDSMLENIEKNKDRFPDMSGTIPSEDLQKMIQRDPDVRRYMQDQSDLITLLSSEMEGKATNLRTNLLKAGKIDISQPIATQIAGLNKIKERARDPYKTRKMYETIKKQNKGEYPEDLAGAVATRKAAEREPLMFPDMYQEGTIYEEDDQKYIIKDGEWADYER